MPAALIYSNACFSQPVTPVGMQECMPGNIANTHTHNSNSWAMPKVSSCTPVNPVHSCYKAYLLSTTAAVNMLRLYEYAFKHAYSCMPGWIARMQLACTSRKACMQVNSTCFCDTHVHEGRTGCNSSLNIPMGLIVSIISTYGMYCGPRELCPCPQFPPKRERVRDTDDAP